MNSFGQDLGAHLFAWSATALAHGLALFALVWSAERLGWLRRPASRQTAWRTVLLVPLLSAALQVFVLGGSPISRLPALQPPAIQTAPAHVAAATPALTASAAPVAAAAPNTETLLYQGASLIGWAWLALVAAGAVRLVAQCHALWRYRRGLAAVSDPATLAMARTLSRHAGLANVKLLDDPHLAGPIALPPRAVVLPSWTREAFSDLQKKALLAHEIRHLARRDPQWRALHGLMALATLAPHGRLALRRLEDMAEYACDAWSAHQTGAGQPLAECLALCMERGLGRRIPAGAAAMAKANSPMVERVRRLLNGKAEGAEANVWVERAMLVVAAGAAALILPGLAIGHGQGPIPTVHRTDAIPSAAARLADADAVRADAEAARIDSGTAEVDAGTALADAETAKADAGAVRIDGDTAQADADAAIADSEAARADADAAREEALRTSADARASASAAAATAQVAAARARSAADATSAVAAHTAAAARASAAAAADTAATAQITATRALSAADAARAVPLTGPGRHRQTVIVTVP